MPASFAAAPEPAAALSAALPCAWPAPEKVLPAADAELPPDPVPEPLSIPDPALDSFASPLSPAPCPDADFITLDEPAFPAPASPAVPVPAPLPEDAPKPKEAFAAPEDPAFPEPVPAPLAFPVFAASAEEAPVPEAL